MGFVDGLKKVVGIEDYDEDYNVSEEELKEAKKKLEKEAPIEAPVRTETSSYGQSYQASPARKEMPMDKRFATQGTTNLKLIVIEPRNFDEARKLVDNLKAKKPIIVNLENLETDTAKKIFDFLSGAIYALSGTVTKVTSNIFIFAPSNVGITESKDDRKTVTKTEKGNPWN